MNETKALLQSDIYMHLFDPSITPHLWPDGSLLYGCSFVLIQIHEEQPSFTDAQWKVRLSKANSELYY